MQLIKHYTHDQIDTEKWDRCIRKSVNGMIYAYSWYLDLVNDSWEALIENDYERVMPLTPGKKSGVHYLFQPVFTQQLGVFSQGHLTQDVVRSFLDAIPARFKLIEINLNTHNKIDASDKNGKLWLTHELDLIKPYEQIKTHYSSNLKRNLKKANKHQINIVQNIKPEDVIQMFRENKGKDLSNLSDGDYDLLRRMIYVLIYKKRAQIIGAFNEMNELCAGAFFVSSGKKMIFYFSATNLEAKNIGAMPLLIDHFIRENSGKHITLDFEGSNDLNLARFYKSFGAEEVHYLHYYQNRLHPILKPVLLGIKKIRQLFL